MSKAIDNVGVLNEYVTTLLSSRTLAFRGLEFAPVKPSRNPGVFEVDDEPRHISLDVEKRMNL